MGLREREPPAITLTTFTTVLWNAPLYTHLGFASIPEDEIGPELRAVGRTPRPCRASTLGLANLRCAVWV